MTFPDRPALLRTAGTLAIGAAGGAAAALMSLPLPWMIGSLVAVAASAIGGLTIAGQPIAIPMWLRFVMVPIIGVLLGASVTPEVARQIPGWWPTILGLVFFVPLASLAVAWAYRRFFGFDPATAYFSGVPGGLVEMAIIGDSHGGDPRFISFIHFGRLTMAVVAVPFALRAIYGPVGSAALKAGQLDTPLAAADVAILAACAIAGFLAGRAMKLPGYQIVGPIVLSAIAHATGLTKANPPYVLIQIAQVVVGASLGARFAGFTPAHIRRGALAIVTGFVMLACCTILAALFAAAVGHENVVPLGLAYAPGGVTEMSLIALSLNFSVAFVTVHHMARIFIAVMVAPWVYGLIWKKKDEGG